MFPNKLTLSHICYKFDTLFILILLYLRLTKIKVLMSSIIEILDGNPHWWNSPDIWIVPGDDPNGSMGQPVAGRNAYVWCRIHNNSDEIISGIVIKFYWSNPATGVLRSNSTLIGSSFADLAGGETKDVLCVIPWIPQYVNDGHECIVVEAIHPSCPLPIPLPDRFNPPEYAQVAQKNLNVLMIQSQNLMVLPIIIQPPKRQSRKLLVQVKMGGELDELSLSQIGLKGYHPAKKIDLTVGISLNKTCSIKNNNVSKELEINLNEGSSKVIYLKVLANQIESSTYIIINVISSERKEIYGGITYVLTKDGGSKS